jgi:TonB family protein
MFFDFEGRYEDYQPIGGSLRRWDGLLLSVGVHALIVLALLFAPALPIFATHRDPEVAALTRPPERPPERPKFVFVQPRLDIEAPKPPPRAEASDKDRIARSPELLRKDATPLPFARGNSPERVEASPDERAAGRGPAPEPAPEPPAPETTARPPEPLPEQPRAELSLPERLRPPQGGSLGEALRNLQKYVDQESFNNDRSMVQNLGPLQFDTKGVEFGPWIRRFVAQVRRNWFIPYAAMSLRGHVVLTFNVHRNGALTDVQVIEPSSIDSFNTAAMNALLASNPTEPLPPEYPADRAFFTVTFYYNESPAGQ